MKRALDNNAAAIVLVHNHPRRNSTPSQSALANTTQSIDVLVHDHLIIAGNDVYSFADHGIL